jgi:hypothetical protein
VTLWEAATGKKMSTLRVGITAPTCLAFSPDGGTLAVGSPDKGLALWDLDSKATELIKPIKGSEFVTSSVAFSPNGELLAAGAYDGTIHVWDLKTGHKQASLSGHKGAVETVAFSPDGRLLASGNVMLRLSGDREVGTAEVKVWELRKGRTPPKADGTDRNPPPMPPPTPWVEREALQELGRWQSLMPETVLLRFRQQQNEREFQGVIKYLKPDRFLVEVREGDKNELMEVTVWDGETVRESMPRWRRAVRERLPQGESPVLLVLLGLKPLEAMRRFEITVAKKDDHYLYLQISPRTAADQDRFRKAELVLTRKTWLPRRLWVEQTDHNTVTWDIIAAETEGPRPEEFQIREMPGWTVIDKGAGEGSKPARSDVLDQLVRDLVKAGRSDEQALEAVYLAVLGRYPTETERLLVGHLSGQKDKQAALSDLVRQLTNTQEFRDKVEALGERARQRPPK